MTQKTHRPAYIKDHHLEYLDSLKNGSLYFNSASRLLTRKFGFEITPEHAKETVHYWIESYDERNNCNQ